jgi:cysteine synthase A
MNIKDLIGNTPIVELKFNIFAKLETFNLSGSIKDRIVLYILNDAERKGLINENTILVEATSGNTGIALAMLGSIKNYKVKIIMPSNMSEERKQLMRLYGAEIIEVGPNDFPGAIALRDKLVQENKNWWSLNQFENPLNVECHETTTAREIIRQVFIDRQLEPEVLICGAGTGGTIMGVGRALKRINKDIRIIQVKPAEDALNHGIQGIGDGGDYLVNPDFIDEVIFIKTEDAIAKAKELSAAGLLVGISAGANVLAAEQIAKTHEGNGAIVTFLCDRGERYLSLYS